MYAEGLRARFPDLHPVVDDLFLLERHQIEALPHRAPPGPLAAVLHARPDLLRFFGLRAPAVAAFLDTLCAAHPPSEDLESQAVALVWELADWIVYQRAPELYDRAGSSFDAAWLGEQVVLEGRVVMDVGAGTGQVALALAPLARHVFAVEPVAALRAHLRAQAPANLFVLDGRLAAIPLPADSVDVLVTRRAIGWAIDEELHEIERVVRRGGHAVHLLGTTDVPGPLHEALVRAGYTEGRYPEGRVYRWAPSPASVRGHSGSGSGPPP